LFAAAAVTFARPPARVHPVVAGNPLAQASWAQSVQASDARPQPLIVLLQLPTVAVLAGCLIALGRAALARETRESD
jgi:hypothetical protein